MRASFLAVFGAAARLLLIGLPLSLGICRAHGIASDWDVYRPQASFFLGPGGVTAPIATAGPGKSLARITAYWKGEDHWTSKGQSSTGIALRHGYCAVDPSVIPYGSVVTVRGVGNFLAVDTGSAVVSRKAARNSGAIVVDLFFETREKAEQFLALGRDYADISWRIP